MAKTIPTINLLAPGTFVTGCNYVASHAGTRMWSEWRPEVVDADLARLAAAGLRMVRVLLLWPDFQPLHLLRTANNQPVEYRQGEEPLAADAVGRAGLDPVMLNRFAEFADLAERHGLKVIVSLITGWMSGRLFLPPALGGRNPITDPVARMWEIRFVREFVRRFKEHPAILAWEPGNECNCMGEATREEAYVWMTGIADAVRAVDPTRPFISGMHGLRLGNRDTWQIQDQSELADLLTTHPYPIFTPHADLDPLNSMRSCLHATAESRFYGDIGGKPCFAEELGTLGPDIASEPIVADYLRTALFSLWAHDCRSLLWWCAFDQLHLPQAPYDWCAVERELGLFRNNGKAKPVVREFQQFQAFLSRLPVPALPPRLVDAVCILSDSQDHWGIAFSSFILAKQAGLDMQFHDGNQPLPAASLYFLPSTTGSKVLSRRRWQELLAKVADGATLYLSNYDGFISGFETMTGLEIQTRARRNAGFDLVWANAGATLPINVSGGIRQQFRTTRAEVLAAEADGNPVFTVAAYGRGKVFFLSFPLEQMLMGRPGVFADAESPAYWKIYAMVVAAITTGRVLRKTAPQIGITEHPLSRRERLAVIINYAPLKIEALLDCVPGWAVTDVLYGGRLPTGRKKTAWPLPGNDALVLRLRR